MRTVIRDVAKDYLNKLFFKADVVINGHRPWDIQVSDPRFYQSVIQGGTLALGETYVEKWWECPALDQFFFRLLRAGISKGVCSKTLELYRKIKVKLVNYQSRRRAFEIGKRHYDAGNDLFELMLDPYMAYSCGYWRSADNLAEAQEAKLDLICRKLNLQPGMRLLDIGCGWGSLVLYAARNFGVEAVGLTVSEEQAKFGRERCSDLPVEILLQDYRELSGTYDVIASVGMFEHVGYKNFDTFMKVVRGSIKEDGLFLLHTIGSNRTVHSCDPWFDKYIFPNGMLPSVKQIGGAIESLFIMEDWQNLGVDYDKTILSWYSNIEEHGDRIKSKYGEKFFRMWRYYLLSVAGGFRARSMQVWQIVLSPKGHENGYRSVRCSQCLT